MQAGILAAGFVGCGELFSGDDHGHLQQQGRHRQQAQPVAGQKRGRHAQNREGQGEIMAAERVQDFDAAGEYSLRLRLFPRLGHDVHGH